MNYCILENSCLHDNSCGGDGSDSLYCCCWCYFVPADGDDYEDENDAADDDWHG